MRRPAACCRPNFTRLIPAERAEQARRAADVLGDIVIGKYPFAGATQPMTSDRAEALLNRTWRPALSITGADGLPAIADARQRAAAANRAEALAAPASDRRWRRRRARDASGCSKPIRRTARRCASTGESGATGWNAPPTDAWLARAIDEASSHFYGKPVGGDGGRRNDPVHGDARQALSRRAVSDHRRAGPALQRARPERIPARALREAS